MKHPGESYPASFYEDLVPHALKAIELSAPDLVAGAAWYAKRTPVRDDVALRRVAAERDRALSQYRREREVAALERRMAKLDDEEQRLRTDVDTPSMPAWGEVLEVIRDLPALWANPDARAEDRKALAEAAFESIDALGARQVAFKTTASAGGVQAVVMVGARGFEPPTS